MKSSLSSFLYTRNLSRLARPFAPFLGSILLFHRVVAPNDKPRLPENQLYEITPHTLRETISFYRERRYAFVSLDEMLQRMKEKHVADRFVCFTFDDGYADTATTVYPMLKEENIPFCVYITTDFPDRKAAFWWDMLEDSLLTHDQLSFSLDSKSHLIKCSSFAEKREAFQTVCQLVLKSDSGISAAWKAIFAPLDLDRSAWAERLAMSWEQITQLGRDPLVTIGAHTCTHPPLAGLTEEEARNEMQNSRAIIQEKTGIKAEHFSYPYGSHLDVTDREARLAASLGFKTAVTTDHGNIYRYHRKNLMRLPRIMVSTADNLQTLTLAADGCIPQTIARF